MRIDGEGFARPRLLGMSTAAPTAAAAFRRSCPGLVVNAARPRGVERHPTMGPVVAAWAAWAADDEMRFAGSSGGALTALAGWLSSTGRAARVVGAAPAPNDARRTVAVALTTREEALASAGSRYAPVAVNALAPQLPGATIGLPCRVSAMRALGPGDEILLSFFCAGTPSQRATDALALRLGSPDPPQSLRYRGNGWPGRFTVRRADGSLGTLSYEESWGEHLGRALQSRCKICPDGVGESADITAADLWEADERGYPEFEDRPGVSALIARTNRGYDLVLDAAAAGVLIVHPLRIERLAAVQPYQESRRTTLAGRLLGSALAGRRVPRYRGFNLLALSALHWQASLRAAVGAWKRSRRERQAISQ
jgi:coenzyme F420 hydrogenase subunit beta